METKNDQMTFDELTHYNKELENTIIGMAKEIKKQRDAKYVRKRFLWILLLIIFSCLVYESLAYNGYVLINEVLLVLVLALPPAVIVLMLFLPCKNHLEFYQTYLSPSDIHAKRAEFKKIGLRITDHKNAIVA